MFVWLVFVVSALYAVRWEGKHWFGLSARTFVYMGSDLDLGKEKLVTTVVLEYELFKHTFVLPNLNLLLVYLWKKTIANEKHCMMTYHVPNAVSAHHFHLLVSDAVSCFMKSIQSDSSQHVFKQNNISACFGTGKYVPSMIDISITVIMPHEMPRLTILARLRGRVFLIKDI